MEQIPSKFDSKSRIWYGPVKDHGYKPDQSYVRKLMDSLLIDSDSVIQINHETDYRMTRNEMRLKAIRIAKVLTEMGYGAGDHITIVSNYCDNLTSILLGVMIIGAISNPLDVDVKTDKFVYFFEKIKPKLIICDVGMVETVEQSLEIVKQNSRILQISSDEEQIESVGSRLFGWESESTDYDIPEMQNPDHIYFIMCTSGTTGPAKGIQISNGMLHSRHVVERNSLIPGAIFDTSSVSWITTIGPTLNPILFPSFKRVITTKHPILASYALEIITKHQVTDMLTFPVFIQSLLNLLENNSNLREIVKISQFTTGGSKVLPSLIDQCTKLIPNVKIDCVYGMTEMCTAIAYSTNSRESSLGSLTSGLQGKIVDENYHAQEPGTFGEVLLKGPFKFPGYISDDVHNKLAYDSDGWFRTGDIGYFNRDGQLFLMDRKTNIFKFRNDHLIVPSVMEQLIRVELGEVVEAISIVGKPDDEWNLANHRNDSFLPTAVVTVRPEKTLKETDLRVLIEKNFPEPNHLSGGIYIVDKMPRTQSGKIHVFAVKALVLRFHNEEKNNHN